MRLQRTHRLSDQSHGDDALDASHWCKESFAQPRLVVWDFVDRLLDVNRKGLRELSDHVEVNVGAIASELCKAARWVDFTITWLSHITARHDHQDLEHLFGKLWECNL